MIVPRTAIIYDRVNTFGGAERVLIELHKLFPDSVLCTSVYDKQGAPWATEWKVIPSFLQHVPFAKKHHQWFALLMPLAFESMDLSMFDIIISVTSESAKNVITRPDQLHICYCLTPTRYLWSHTHFYQGGHTAWLKQLLFSPLRMIDWVSARRPDVYVAISRTVQERIQHTYQRTVDAVIYPPVTSVALDLHVTNKSESSLLCVSRLVPYKRVDLVIQAAQELNLPLTIIGTGSDERRLRSLVRTGQQVTFLGRVSDAQLTAAYQEATLVVCPQEEDFGIVAVEAAMRGLPVVGYARGGIGETVVDGVTGVIFHEQTIESLCGAIQRALGRKWDGKRIHAHAMQYASDVFAEEFLALVTKHWEKLQK